MEIRVDNKYYMCRAGYRKCLMCKFRYDCKINDSMALNTEEMWKKFEFTTKNNTYLVRPK